MSLIKKTAVIFVTLILSIKCGDFLVGKLNSEIRFPIEQRGLDRSINLLEINPGFKASNFKVVPFLCANLAILAALS